MLSSGTMYTLGELIKMGEDLLKTKPRLLQIGNENSRVAHWVDVDLHFVRWLIKNKHLVPSRCPVPTSKGSDKFFINVREVHGIPERDGDWRKVGDFYVDIKYSAPYHVSNLHNTLKHLGISDPGIKISLR